MFDSVSVYIQLQKNIHFFWFIVSTFVNIKYEEITNNEWMSHVNLWPLKNKYCKFYFIFLGGNQLPEPQVPPSRSRFFKPISLSPTASSTPNSSHKGFNPDPAIGSPDLHSAADPSLTPYDDLDELSRLDRVGPALDQNDHPGKLEK